MPFRLQFVRRGRPGRAAVSCAAAVAILAIAAPARAGNHNVTVGDSFFAPANLTIQVGDTVTWTKGATFLPHNVLSAGNFRCANGCDDAGGNGNPTNAPWSFSRTFDRPGQITYLCQVHGAAMSGTITVEGSTPEPGALRFSSGSFSRNEGGVAATITVQRVNGSSGAVSVDYATGGGSATANADYTPASGTLNWGNGDTSNKSFNVLIVDDTADEPNETVGLSLEDPTGGATLGSPSNATLTIVDNDDSGPGPSAGNLRFNTGSQSVQENAGPATAVVQRTGGSAGMVSVQYDSAGGSAAEGVDYTGVSGILTWAGGDAANKSFQVPIIDDTATESAETFSLMLSAPTGGATVVAPGVQTVTVLDDDGVAPGPCIEDDHTICLLDQRFRVEVFFTPPGGVEQPANAIPFTNRAGMFWFFNEQNIEMLFKMVNACNAPPLEPYFWVFYAATTNVEFRVIVTDTEALQAKPYGNPPGGMAAQPVTDTAAFDTCP